MINSLEEQAKKLASKLWDLRELSQDTRLVGPIITVEKKYLDLAAKIIVQDLSIAHGKGYGKACCEIKENLTKELPNFIRECVPVTATEIQRSETREIKKK